MLEFVFFFKQKTAYELRISDWSSDVCSSDLHPSLRILPCWCQASRELPEQVDQTAWDQSLFGADRWEAQVAPGYERCHLAGHLWRQGSYQSTKEIGRASGRESVCQYG